MKIKIKTDIIYSKLVSSITIIHMADIHFNINTKMKMLNQIRNMVISSGANYVIVTGDIIDEEAVVNSDKINELITFFNDISKKVKVIISLGNHDVFSNYHTFFNKLDKLDNVYVLDNFCYCDQFIYVCGFTLSRDYYYSNSMGEDIDILLRHLDKHKEMINNLPKSKIKIALLHSPMKLTDSRVLDKIKEYDLVLSGHMHDGMVPEFLKFLFGNNRGIISPYKKIFPKFARGNLCFKLDGREIKMIVTGGVTKLSLKSTKLLSKLNFIYNVGINKIIIQGKR